MTNNTQETRASLVLEYSDAKNEMDELYDHKDIINPSLYDKI